MIEVTIIRIDKVEVSDYYKDTSDEEFKEMVEGEGIPAFMSSRNSREEIVSIKRK